jgi:hypothetical protein
MAASRNAVLSALAIQAGAAWGPVLGAAVAAAASPACVESEGKGAPLAEASTGSTAPATRPSGAGYSAPAPPAAQAPGPVDTALCTSICEHSQGLHCQEAASCVRRCVAMQTVPQCQAEIRGALGCFESTPPAGWVCNEHGLPSVRVGICDAEQARAAKCLAASPPVAPR